MALVAYDNSDSSEYEDDNGACSGILVQNDKTNNVERDAKKIIEETTENVNTNQQDDSLFTQLPKPTSGRITIVEEDDEFLHKKAVPTTAPKPKPKITIPSLSDFKDVEDTVPASKPKVNYGKKSGLLNMLPQPRNGFLASNTSLIPNSIKQKPHTSSVKKKELPTPKVATKPSTLIEYSDESDEEVQNDFFSINKPVEALPDDLPPDIEENTTKNSQTDTNKRPRSIESYFKKEDNVSIPQQEDYIEFNSEPMEESVPESSNNEIALDEEAILKLCGARGKRKHEEIQIIDINQQEVLNDAREMLLKGLMDDTSQRQSASKKRGNEPTSQQRRKHQITYLAHQAKANEAELQNQWANNRMTKRKTQSKYGF